MRLLALALLFVVQDAKPTPPIEPLVALAAKLDAGAAAFLRDGKLAEAYKPWPVAEDEDKPAGPIRDALKAAGVVTLSTLDVQLQLLYYKKDKPCAWLKAMVYLDGANSGFTSFLQSAAGSSALLSRAATLDAVKAFEPLLADAARETAAAIKAKGEEGIVFPDPDLVVTRLGGREFGEAFRGYIKIARDSVKGACAEIKRLEPDEVRVRPNIVRYVALDRNGWAIGTVDARFGAGMDLAFVITDWRPFKK